MDEMITVTVVGDTVNPDVPSARITSLQYTAPRFLLAEINTHGLLAKSAASSRAIPVKRRIVEVYASPFVPQAFGRNKPGMQAEEELGVDATEASRRTWLSAAHRAVEHAEDLEGLEVHKQHANRVLEPYAYVTGLVTATEWDNFFKLRISPESQPEFNELATKMKAAIEGSTPLGASYHLPYVQHADLPGHITLNQSLAISTARCARVSYKSFKTGKASSFDEDLALCHDLLSAGHMSPFDHVASADFPNRVGVHYRWMQPERHGRYWGWISHRDAIERLRGVKTRRSSFEPFTL